MQTFVTQQRKNKMISKIKDLDLSQETLEDLKLMLYNELYIDINSPFAKELNEEIESRDNK